MQESYYINNNQQPSRDYEVHKGGCSHPPLPENRIHLGYFNGCQEAVREAQRRFPHKKNLIDGCYWCIEKCHNH